MAASGVGPISEDPLGTHTCSSRFAASMGAQLAKNACLNTIHWR